MLGELPKEIHHTFTPPPEHPNIALSLGFTSLVVFSLLAFLVSLFKLKLNSELIKKVGVLSSFLFFGVILSTLGLYVWFWAQGNLLDTLKVLALMTLPALLVLKKFFQAHA